MNINDKNESDLFVIVNHCEFSEIETTTEEIISQCLNELNGREPKAGMLFCGINMDHQYLVTKINDTWPQLALVGCTTDGEISSKLGFRDDSIAFLLFGGNNVDFTTGLGTDADENLVTAGKNAIKEARSKTKLKPSICFVFPPGLVINSDIVLKTIKRSLGADVPIFGATAADQWKFTGTYQFYNNNVVSNSIPVLLLSGSLNYSYAVESGCKLIGDPGIVTKSDGDILIEIDGEPATNFYKKFLGKKGKPNGKNPLAIVDKNNDIIYIRATPGNTNPKTGSIPFNAEIPVNSKVQITTASKEEILEACRTSILNAKRAYPEGKNPQAAIFFSCATRKLVLGPHTVKEIEIIRSEIVENIPIIGFYGYGEIGPRKKNKKKSEIHNHTFVSLLLGV